MSNYSYSEHFNTHLLRLIRFDSIRIQKLFEITQYMILTILIASYLSDRIDKYMGPIQKDITTQELIKEILIQTLLIILGCYYIPKIVMLFPFFLQFGNYIPNKKNESKIGISVAMSMGFIYFQTNYRSKLNELNRRIFKNNI